MLTVILAEPPIHGTEVAVALATKMGGDEIDILDVAVHPAELVIVTV